VLDADFIVRKDEGTCGMQKATMRKMYGFFGIHLAWCHCFQMFDIFPCNQAAFGPPYALLQGTLEVDGVPFKEIAREACPAVKRGSVAWIASGPEFLISLADHSDWKDAYTVFGYVLPEDLAIAEEMAQLPTSTDVWSNVTVKVLKDPVFFKVKRRTNASAV
jgi:hypothetical protein